MAKYTKHRKQKQHRRRKSLRKTRRRIPRTKRGGYSPIEREHGGNYGPPIQGYPEQSSGALPDPVPSVPY